MEEMKKYEQMSRQELLTEMLRLRAELAGERARSQELESQVSVVFKTQEESKHTVLERRPYRNGYLTNEYRINAKTGTASGPYWQYRGVEDGKQINLYLGKTDDPEAKAEEKLASRGGGDR